MRKAMLIMEEKKNRLKVIFNIITAVVFIVFVITLCPKEMQNDTFWSIKVGERLVRDGIFGLDYFSIHENLNYIAHHFLTDVVIYLVYNVSGFAGLYALEIFLACIMSGLLLYLNNLISKNRITAVILFILQMIILSGYIAVRAQMISFILFILEIIFLEKYKKSGNSRYIVYLSVIPVLLANFHMGVVPFYFIILGVYGISCIKFNFLCFETVEKTDKKSLLALIIVGVIGLVTIFLNPYGIDGVVYPFKTFGNKFITSTISEFKPYSVWTDGGLSLFYSAIILFVLIINKGKIKLNDILLIFGTLFMNYTSIRYGSLFVICSSVGLRYTSGLNTFFDSLNSGDKKALYCEILFVVFLLIARRIAFWSDEYIPEDTYPVKATEYLKGNISSDIRIFNEYSWGAYLMLNDIKVYIDSRCDLYTEEYSNVTIATDYKKIIECDKEWKDILKEYNINTFLIEVDTSLYTLLSESSEFNEVYRDDTAVIYCMVK